MLGRLPTVTRAGCTVPGPPARKGVGLGGSVGLLAIIGAAALAYVGGVHVDGGDNAAGPGFLPPVTGTAFASPAFHSPIVPMEPRFAGTFGSQGNGEEQFADARYIASNSTHLFVTQNNRDYVQVFYDNGTFAGKLGGPGSGDAQFSSPTGMDYNGTHLFVADKFNNRVQIFNSSGGYAGSFGTNGNDFRPDGIAVTPTHIFALSQNKEQFQIFNASGGYLGTKGGVGGVDGKFYNVAAIAYGRGHVFVADATRDDVQVFDASGAYVGKFGGPGSGDGQFKSPSGIAYAHGHLFVTDSVRDDVQIFDASGAYVGKFGGPGSGDGQFRGPYGVAYNSTHLFVLDSNRHNVQTFVVLPPLDVTPDYVGKFGSPGSGTGQFDNLQHVASNSTHLFVTQNNRDYVQVFYDNGTFAGKLGGPGSGDAQFSSPTGMDYNGTHLFVADKTNNRVQIFDSSGGYAGSFGVNGGEFEPEDVAVTHERIFVLSQNREEFQVFDTSGNYLGTKGGTGAENGKFRGVHNIASSPTHVFVTDFYRDDVQIFDTAGSYVGKFGGSGSGDGRLWSPSGIAYAHGHLFVADYRRDDVQIFDTAGSYVGKLGGPGSGDGLFVKPYSLASNSTHLFALDMGRNDVQMFSILGSGTAGNAPPALDPIGAQSTDEGSELRLTAAATDPDGGQAITYSTNATSLGASISPSTGVFSWTPTESQGPGTYHVEIRATDDGSPPLSASRAFTVTVREVNQAPAVGPIGARTVDEGTQLTFAATATDPDGGQAITYSTNATSLGASISPSTGVFSWTPTESQGPGTYHVEIRATDDGSPPLSASRAFTVTVREVNQAPAVGPIGARTVDEGTQLTFAATATDPDGGQAITYSTNATSLGASISPSTGVFSWTPTESQGPGTYHVEIRATDDGSPPLSASRAFTVTVREVNVPPVLSAIGPKSATAGSQLTIPLSATDADLPANTLTYSDDATFGTLSGSTFTWTPTRPDVGSHVVRFSASDGNGGTDHEDVAITVSAAPNAAPSLAALAPKSADEGSELRLTAAATDPDGGQAMTYSTNATSLGASISPSTGVFSWTPTESQGPGTYHVEIRATDDGSPPLSDSRAFTVTVREVNVPPVLSAIGPKSATAGSQLTIPLSATDADLPANTLTYSDDATFGTLSGSTFTWTPTRPDVGSHVVRFSASDGNGGTDHEDVAITVSAAPNAAPSLAALAPKSADEGSELRLTAAATDPDGGQAMTYSTNATSLGASISPSTGVFSWTPTESQGPGTYHVEIRATDDGSPPLSDSRAFTVTVREVNVPPVLAPIGDMSTNVLEPLTFTATAADEDRPRQALEFSLAGAVPGGASITPRGAFSWTPSDTQNGTHRVVIQVSDGAATDDESIAITVNPQLPDSAIPGSFSPADSNPVQDSAGSPTPGTPGNTPPVISDPADGTHFPNAEVGLAFSIDVSATDADVPADTLTYGKNVSVGTIDPRSGLFEWIPRPDEVGQHGIRFHASDGRGGGDAVSVTVNVSAGQRAPVPDTDNSPVIEQPLNGTTFSVPVGGNVTIDVNATDPDDDADDLRYKKNSPGAIDPQSGVYTWIPQASEVGSHDIRLTVSDPHGNTDTVLVTVRVFEPSSSQSAQDAGAAGAAAPKVCR